MAENSKIETVDPLLVFCDRDIDENKRFNLYDPCVISGHRYYTDGKIAVRVEDSSPDTKKTDPPFPRSIADLKQWDMNPTDDGCVPVEFSVAGKLSCVPVCELCKGNGRGKFRECPDCFGFEKVTLTAPASKTEYRVKCKYCVDGISRDGNVDATCPRCSGRRIPKDSTIELEGHLFGAGYIVAMLEIFKHPFSFIHKWNLPAFRSEPSASNHALIVDFFLDGQKGRAVLMGIYRVKP